ncbi:MAG: hypothetical protein MJD61_10780 [Proteobacteria bacterium]|nr:hypothetical protein [Pseudomonadota bacterium]
MLHETARVTTKTTCSLGALGLLLALAQAARGQARPPPLQGATEPDGPAPHAPEAAPVSPGPDAETPPGSGQAASSKANQADANRAPGQPAVGVAAASARAWFDKGVALSSEGRWNDALAAFERSRRLVPRPSTLFNLAVVYYRLGRSRETLWAVKEYRRLTPGHPAASESAELARLAERAEAEVATLLLTVSPEHAELRLDGALLHTLGPVRTLVLDPGLHRLQVGAPGFVPKHLELPVLAGEKLARRVTLAAVARAPKPRADTPVPLPGQASPQPAAPRPSGPLRVEVAASAAPTNGAAAAAPAQDQTDRPEPGTSPKRLWTWVSGSAAVAFGATAAVVWRAGLARARALEPRAPDCALMLHCPGQAPVDRSPLLPYEVVTSVSLALAGSSTAAAFVLYFVEAQDSRGVAQSAGVELGLGSAQLTVPF